jgi:hypothetical protein
VNAGEAKLKAWLASGYCDGQRRIERLEGVAAAFDRKTLLGGGELLIEAATSGLCPDD